MILEGFLRVKQMKQVVLIATIAVMGLTSVGCQPESTAYQYRAGTAYEYKQLMDAWIPNNDTFPPLPPISEGSEGEWVKVRAFGTESEPLSGYDPQPRIYVDAFYGVGRPYMGWRHGPAFWHWRRGCYGSGLSIGFSFGSGWHRPGWGRYGYWDDWNCDWPHTGAHRRRHFRW